MALFNFPVITEARENALSGILGAQNEELTYDVGYLRSEVIELQEDMLRISDAFDNIGWSPLPEAESQEIKLETVKKVAKVARALNAMNPFVKRGVNARISYIWGKGVTFDGVDDVQDQLDENRRKLFSPQSYEELERVLATDGNAFTALPLDTDYNARNFAGSFRIGLDEIMGVIANPLDREEIWYYKREYKVTVVNGSTGQSREDSVVKYYPSMWYAKQLEKQGKSVPKRWNKVGVEQNYVIQHTAVNKQVGWRWGVPDIMPVIFWAKAYKEYLEDNAMLVKAYSRLAWQIKVPNNAAGQAAATQVMTPPTRDPMTGETRNVGGTAIQGAGGALAPIAATGSSVDFTKGSALASAIASGLEVSLVVITSDPGSGNRATAETLDLPTLKAMESRQKIHTERFLELFEFWGADITPNATPNGKPKGKTKDVSEAFAPNGGADNAKPTTTPVTSLVKGQAQSKDANSTVAEAAPYAVVTWPQIETDTTKDRIAAIGTATELGVLFKQEARKEALDVFGIAPYKPWDQLPTMADDPAAQEQQQITQDNADRQFANEQELTKQSVIAKQGVSGGVAAKGGAQTSSNAARTARKKDTGNS